MRFRRSATAAGVKDIKQIIIIRCLNIGTPELRDVKDESPRRENVVPNIHKALGAAEAFYFLV